MLVDGLLQMACAYRFAAAIEDVDMNWMVAYGIDPTDIVSCYVVALYWSSMTITTVGYGDVVRECFSNSVTELCVRAIAGRNVTATVNCYGLVCRVL